VTSTSLFTAGRPDVWRPTDLTIHQSLVIDTI
jgi:hypothetical protein